MLTKDEIILQLKKCYKNEFTYEESGLLNEEKEEVGNAFKEFLEQNMSLVQKKPALTMQILHSFVVGDNKDSVEDVPLLEAYAEKADCDRIFEAIKNDTLLAANVKNKYMFELIEVIRFAGLQKKNLKDNASYNRHVEKCLTDMMLDLRKVFMLDTDLVEIQMILDKYLEYNIYVNTPKNWVEFHSLSEFEGFRKYLETKHEFLLKTYLRNGLVYDSIKPYAENLEEDALKVLKQAIKDFEMDEPKKVEPLMKELSEKVKKAIDE